MKYPTIEEVNQASHEQLARWWRFLQSPGMAYIGTGQFEEMLAKEGEVMERISERLFEEFNGFTPEISKRIGW